MRPAIPREGRSPLSARIPHWMKKALEDLAWRRRSTVTIQVIDILKRALSRTQKATA